MKIYFPLKEGTLTADTFILVLQCPPGLPQPVQSVDFRPVSPLSHVSKSLQSISFCVQSHATVPFLWRILLGVPKFLSLFPVPCHFMLHATMLSHWWNSGFSPQSSMIQPKY